jgi:ribosomal-protein-alanine N-acetyltransferase
MVKPLNLVIESERLRLVAISEDYAETIFREFTAEITTFMFPKSPDEIEETLSYIRESRGHMANGEEFSAAILLKETGEYIGGGGLHHINGETPELGIWIKKGAHGHGYGREAVGALARWAFENLSVRYLAYPVDRRNVASRKIPESLGGVIAAEYEYTNMSGRVLDLVQYHIYPPLSSELGVAPSP